jgi:hypothetical protein
MDLENTGLPDQSPETAPAAAPPQAAPSETPGLLGAFSKRGYDVSGFKSDDDLIDGFEAIVKEQRDFRSQMLPQVRQFSEHRGEYEKWLAEQHKKNQPPEPEKPKFWSPAKYDEGWLQRSKFDAANGKYVPATEYDSPTAAESLNEYLKWQKDASRKLLTDPAGIAWQGGIEQKVQELVESRLSAMQEQQMSQQSAVRVVSENASWLFEHDQSGKVMNDAQGRPYLTQMGQEYRRLVDEAVQLGIQGELNQDTYAKNTLAGMIASHRARLDQQAAAPAGQPPAAPPDPKTSFQDNIRQTTRRPSRNGAASEGEVTDVGKTFQQLARDEMRARGINT